MSMEPVHSQARIAIDLIREHFAKGVTFEEEFGSRNVAPPKRVELFDGQFCWQIGANFFCSDEFMEALRRHPYIEYLETAGDYKIQQPPLPKKISKPKHTPPFWANNWRKK